MSIETIVVCGVLILASLYAVIAPFSSKQAISADAVSFQRQRDALLVYYQQVTSSLRDLQEDLTSGKLTQDEYDAEYEKWMQRGIQILKVLEELDNQNQPLMAHSDTTDVNQAIEDAVQNYLKSQKTVSAAKE